MVILFIGMATSYTDGMTYQDQLLAAECVNKGHEVHYISDAHEFVNGRIVDVEPRDRRLSNGVHLIQVKYDRVLCDFLTDKLRQYKKIDSIVEKIHPDVIYIHGPHSIALYRVLKYVKKHPEVKLMVDSHADYYTSGTNWISRKVLHGFIYRRISKECLKYTDKLLCIAVNCVRFAEEVYKIPKERLELYSLGGVCLKENERQEIRSRVREKMNWDENTVVFLQAGKIDEKKCLLEAVREFMGFDNSNWRYVVIGNIVNGIKEQFDEYCEADNRIEYLGWRSGDEIIEYLAACDLYVQPGKGSAIAQNAMCAGAPVCLRSLEDYVPFVKGNGWLIETPEKLSDVFGEIKKDKSVLVKYSDESKRIARELLDYEMLAKKIYE